MRKGLWIWSASALVAGGMAFTASMADDVGLRMPTGTAQADEMPADPPARQLPSAFLPADEGDAVETVTADEEEETPRPFVRQIPTAQQPARPTEPKRRLAGVFEDSKTAAAKPAEAKPADTGTAATIPPSAVPGKVHVPPPNEVELLAPPASKTGHPLALGNDVEEPSSSQKIVPAEYETKAGDRQPIQPVSATSRFPRSAPPARRDAAPPPPVRTAAAPAPSATSPSDAVIANTEPPCVTVRWRPSGELSVGQESVYHLHVRNEGKGTARDVEVHAYFPRSARLVKSEPNPTTARDHLAWTLAQLSPGEEKHIAITLIPMSRGEMSTNCTVRYATGSAISAQVSEPQLALAVKGASSATAGETITHIVSVSNSGTGTARDVVVKAVIPAGLESHQGKGKLVQMAVGSLAAGETKDVRLQLTALGAGEQVVAVEATGAAGLEDHAQAKVVVTAPKLEVAVAGPSLRYCDRHARYQLTAANKGAAATSNVRLTHHVPEGFEFVRAEGGGTYDAASRTVGWFVGQLAPGKAVTATVELKACTLGSHVHRVQVTGDSVAAVEARCETKVDGSADLVMEVKDLDDPVEVHTQTAYEIKVRNDGSKAATNVSIVCELPAGVEVLGAEGQTKHTVEKGRVVFAPVAEVGPGKTLKCRVLLEGKTAGQLRFRALLSSSSITDPVVVEELTRFYAD